MTERLWGVRPNVTVTRIDPALAAAVAWAQDVPDRPTISDLLAAFCAGASWQREQQDGDTT
jgi:hypothetical protein